MNYTSTRDNTLNVSSGFAVTGGISAEGGLFVPREIPRVDADFLASLVPMTYIERAKAILSLYLTDFPEKELAQDVENAYGKRFSHPKTAPVVNLRGNVNILELWHGPTCAFKDMALQLLPYLLTGSARRVCGDREIVILVATSGDTGKAALEGFRDVPGTRILVFYPNDGVSPMQKRQMTTQQGENVGVCAIYGNFDDAQTGVKKIFTDPAVKARLAENGMAFSSANSINWGRLAPQIVYYFSAYAEMAAMGQIRTGDKINVTVPTGNFGNILAAWYAKEMGLPVNRLICASNANDVLTEFLTTGRYNRNRPFHTTVSPSMDILISSNLERLLFHLCGGDSDRIKDLFGQLAAKGEYTVDGALLEKIRATFSAGCCDDAATKRTIASTFRNDGYLCDTHTAVAVAVYENYRRASGDDTPAVIASTASPYKFSAAVLGALEDGDVSGMDEFGMLDRIEALTGVPAPAQLKALKNAVPRFTGICTKEEMEGAVYSLLGVK